MTTQYSNLDIQFILSSLATKTDQEIADILEFPVDDVRTKIEELTGGSASERESDVAKYKEEKEEQNKIKRRGGRPVKPTTIKPAKVKPEREQRPIDPLKERSTQRIKEHKKTLAEVEKYRAQSRAREDRSKFKTRVVDHSKMMTIPVGKGTYIQIPKGSNINEQIAIYEANCRARASNSTVDLEKIKQF